MSEGLKPAVLVLQGAIGMDNAAELLEKGRQGLASGALIVDFAAVSSADSAALALILDWLRCARAHNHDLQLRNLPAGLSSLATLYDVDGLLPLAAR
ncbi:MAG: STAS domain-containing protein [Thauera sp.]|jgi:phospholipid transport system transporter-binding protein|nr:STAS domain-containing protein [Thauera sp.]